MDNFFETNEFVVKVKRGTFAGEESVDFKIFKKNHDAFSNVYYTSFNEYNLDANNAIILINCLLNELDKK